MVSRLLSPAALRLVTVMALSAVTGSSVLAIAVPAATGAQASAREPFVLAGQSVPAGQRVHIDVPVPAGASDPATTIPVTVFHGVRPGPTLALTAGVHGFEYPPILAAQHLLDAHRPVER